MAENNLAALLRDFAQGASNSAATNLSMPVDALAWLLRKGGVNVPNNPVGGSDWLAEKGFTPEPKNKLAGLLGDVAGFAAPLAAVTKAPQIAKGLLQAGENLAKPNVLNSQRGAIVWHGSPHKFDAFDASKIGTGEGAQAYGHGLYLAESPKTAEFYKEIGKPEFRYKNEILTEDSPIVSILDHANANGFKTNKDLVKFWEERVAESKAAFDKPELQKIDFRKRLSAEMLPKKLEKLELSKTLEPSLFQVNKPVGQLYKVDLPDEHIAKMLDWDKPLSQQAPDVQSAIKSSSNPMMQYWAQKSKENPAYNGADLMLRLAGEKSNNAAASELLRQQGITGIKYLDGGSRAAGAGSQNFVIFPKNERLLRILERNGSPIN